MRYLVLALMLTTLLPACGSIDARSEARKLEQTLNSFGTAVRWQPLAQSYSFLTPKLQPETPPTGLENIRVTGYEVAAAPREIADGKVVQTVVIEYVLIDQQALRTLTDNQLWERNADGQWERANPMPVFR